MHPSITRFGLLLALPALLFLSACDRNAPEDDHGDIARVELVARDGSNAVVAEYTRQGGWQPQTLPALTPTSTAPFGRAAWTVRIFDSAGNQLVTPSPRNPDGSRTCGEYSARYVVRAGNEFVYDPGTSSTTNVSDIAVNINGVRQEVFHCDHLYVYPRAAGTAQIEILLWHVDHADGATRPLQIPILAAPPTAAPAVAAD